MVDMFDEKDKPTLKIQNRNLKIVIVILIISSLFIAFFLFILQQYMFTKHTIYTGLIKLEPKSERSNAYLSFEPDNRTSKKSYMILVKDLKFNEKLESFIDKRVQATAKIYLHEPNDFDKIEILEVKAIN